MSSEPLLGEGADITGAQVEYAGHVWTVAGKNYVGDWTVVRHEQRDGAPWKISSSVDAKALPAGHPHFATLLALGTEAALAADDLCTICGQPVLDGQARYARSGNHYDCEFPKGQADLRDAIAAADSALAAMTGKKPRRAPRPVGEGRVGARVKKLVFEALKPFVDGEPTDVVMWIQDPEHRGPRWDLACWGLHCKYGERQVSVYSWATMTACAKSKALDIYKEGAIEFQVGPARASSA